MTRRIVQIAVVGHENDQLWQGHSELFALCDDGSFWAQLHGEAAWHRLHDIPQDEPAVDPNEPVDVETLNVVRGFAGLDPLAADPIAEIEAMGGFLNIREAGIAWSVVTNEEQDIWLDEPVTSDRDVQLSDLRAAAARLLERIRGAK